ncbi:LacI family DNA-binding transcriptional regulator [Actinotalea sp. BY-33]|uniref:LacI family DNA-binding transcriptional regulator n=1 Tax=Actinotalea soli TaxID=2819234 RepID=A0A939LQD3_9CELL|nr:LacI family DNA-binding transcriptional regulator [Actinotalea soli]MBO1752556.1 LacI family DNA-binding transcriptional regulator [Actinotalea soli]
MGKARIGDVAALAGVSVATVSNVLNRPEKVTPPLVDRVRAAIDELQYVPHMPARQLRSGRSATIGISVLNAANPFFGEIVSAAELAAVGRDLSVMVGSSHESPTSQDKYLDVFEQFRFAGIIVTPVSQDLERLRRLHARGIPVVLVDQEDPTRVLPSVSGDHLAGGRLGGEHLVAAGCTRVTFVAGPLAVPQIAERLQGCEEAVGDHAGVELTVHSGPGMDIDLGRVAGEEILRLPASRRPDGVFAANDMQAIGIMQAFLAAGLRVPEDVRMLGYDDIAFAAVAAVPLTSIRQPSREIGRTAATLLMDPAAAQDVPAARVRYTPELVVRESTAGAGVARVGSPLPAG